MLLHIGRDDVSDHRGPAVYHREGCFLLRSTPIYVSYDFQEEAMSKSLRGYVGGNSSTEHTDHSRFDANASRASAGKSSISGIRRYPILSVSWEQDHQRNYYLLGGSSVRANRILQYSLRRVPVNDQANRRKHFLLTNDQKGVMYHANVHGVALSGESQKEIPSPLQT